MTEDEVAAVVIGPDHDMRPLLYPNTPNLACHLCNACTCHAETRLFFPCLGFKREVS